jgi:hypothetical protein
MKEEDEGSRGKKMKKETDVGGKNGSGRWKCIKETEEGSIGGREMMEAEEGRWKRKGRRKQRRQRKTEGAEEAKESSGRQKGRNMREKEEEEGRGRGRWKRKRKRKKEEEERRGGMMCNSIW